MNDKRNNARLAKNTTPKFAKTTLALSIAGLLCAPSTFAAGEEAGASDNVEVIAVKGMRESIKESTRLKRDAAGVVDAISAEDIGKFPDTNLAESLQRITGVSIDRVNGEGSKITVRGFGPDFNMVTLNGRYMPASTLPAGGGVANSRAFDFANLASDAVKSVSVYKTGRANIASGGIGATVNIVTAKPLDMPGFKANFGAKALSDSTNRVGDNMTPEYSGLLSWTDEDEKFGASITANFQERHSSATVAFVNQWRTSAYDGNIPQASDNIAITNEPAIGQLYSLPSDLRYAISDRERSRLNYQATFQFRPSEDLTATLDYTYSEQDLFEARAEQSIWMDSYKTAIGFDDGTVASPLSYQEERLDLAPRDLGLAQQQLNQRNENKSVGLNIEYVYNDELTITFDGHSSTADSSPDALYGSWTNVGLGANVIAGQSVDFSQTLPTLSIMFDDCAASRGLNCNSVLDQSDVGTSILDMNFASQKTDIDQFRLMADYQFEGDNIEGGIDFGIESRAMESNSVQSLTRHTMGNWGIDNPNELPAGFLTATDFTSGFDDFNANGAFNQGVTANAATIGQWAAGNYGFNMVADGAFATNRTIKEDVTAAYAQLSLKGEIGGKTYNFLAGVRYEDTEVTSIANVTLPNAVAWESNDDFNVRFGTGTEDYATTATYDHILPSIDFDIQLTDDIKARFSYSTTIARPTYDQLSSAAGGISGPSGPTLIAGSQLGTASSGNPALAPVESDNIDLSVEWYFDDTSYVSIGYYDKSIENFAGRAPVVENVYGLRDVTAGPRAQAAAAALNEMGLPVNETNLFTMVAAMENNVAFDSMSIEEFEATYDVLPNESDPLMEFTVTKFVNNKEANIDGWEFAVQHFFGETGFGFQANYTTVNGDIGFDVNADPTVTQFALIGLSDTANLVFMYEKDALQLRVAYNWRDKFLDNAARYINEPSFTESYSQIDLSASYEVNENLSVFFEAINLTEQDSRQHGRSTTQLWHLEEQGARYGLGARYSF